MPSTHNNSFSPVPPSHFSSVGQMASVARANGEVVDAQALAKLEELDDTMFGALEGDADALNRAARIWRVLQSDSPERMPVELLDESRRQYIRQAEAICSQYQKLPGETLGKVFAALEVLALLAD